MRTSELVFIALIFAFSAFLGYQSLDFRYLSNQGFGPGFVPLNFALATAVLGVLIWLKFRKKDQGDRGTTQLKERLKASFPAILAVLLLLAATYSMHFGSILAPLLVVMMLISLFLLGHTLIRALFTNVVTVAAVFGIFNLWLGIPVT